MITVLSLIVLTFGYVVCAIGFYVYYQKSRRLEKIIESMKKNITH